MKLLVYVLECLPPLNLTVRLLGLLQTETERLTFGCSGSVMVKLGRFQTNVAASAIMDLSQTCVAWLRLLLCDRMNTEKPSSGSGQGRIFKPWVGANSFATRSASVVIRSVRAKINGATKK